MAKCAKLSLRAAGGGGGGRKVVFGEAEGPAISPGYLYFETFVVVFNSFVAKRRRKWPR